MKMRDDIYLPQTNIKYKIVKLVLLWSFYRKNYFRKIFIKLKSHKDFGHKKYRKQHTDSVHGDLCRKHFEDP